MRRTQILLDEAVYQALKQEARVRNLSMSEVVRQLAHEHLFVKLQSRYRSAHDLPFVAIGRSNQTPGDRLYPISEHVDEALAEDF